MVVIDATDQLTPNVLSVLSSRKNLTIGSPKTTTLNWLIWKLETLRTKCWTIMTFTYLSGSVASNNWNPTISTKTQSTYPILPSASSMLRWVALWRFRSCCGSIRLMTLFMAFYFSRLTSTVCKLKRELHLCMLWQVFFVSGIPWSTSECDMATVVT